MQRANYQAAVLLHALVPSPDIPGPDGHGWRVSNDEIFIDWMDQQPAPAELLQFVSCGCQTGCTTGRCSCARAGLQCTDAFTCTNSSSRGAKHSSQAGDDDEGLDGNGPEESLHGDSDEGEASDFDCDCEDP